MSPENSSLPLEFLDDYFAECDEHLKTVRRTVLALEPFVDQPRADRPLLDELFRSLHTLKGLSAMVGLGDVERLAHEMESYLRALREEQATLSSGAMDALMAGTKALEAAIAAQRAQSPSPLILPVIEQMATLTARIPPPQPASPRNRATAAAPDTELNARLAAARQDGTAVWCFEFTPAQKLADRGVTVDTIRARLLGAGEILQAAPQIAAGGKIIFEFLVATRQDPAAFAGWQEDGLAWTAYEPPAGAEPSAETRLAAPGLAPSHLVPPSVVRVDLARLDELMQMVGELVISRARLEDNLVRIETTVPTAQWRTLQEVNVALEHQLRDLREGVMRVRLVPIGEVFERMQFVVRDLARERRQQITLEMSGQQTEIDKLVVERMTDPLLHLVRNAVSHGLEPAEERLAQGKPAEGRVRLQASTVGDTVEIVVEDNGRGINRDAVAAHARDMGLLAPEATLDDAALLDMLCTPGFSTREQADRASGRGMGLSVVQNAVGELGGSLTLNTKPGQGTRFTIRLPLTLAIVDALLVLVGGQTFAAPLPSVRDVLEVLPQTVTSLGRDFEEMIPYGGGVLPLVRLADLFGLEAHYERTFHVFVVGGEARLTGVAVDRIVGQREIVVRSITDPLARVPGVAGATELGDGRPILILDTGALARMKGVQR